MCTVLLLPGGYPIAVNKYIISNTARLTVDHVMVKRKKGKVHPCTGTEVLYRPYGKVHPCAGTTAHTGSTGIALAFHEHGTRRGCGVSVMPWPLSTPGKDPVPIVQEAGWAPGPVWTGAENLSPTGIRSPNRPAHSQSLYRLSYPAHDQVMAIPIKLIAK
jgi:hypothetical protein